MNDLEKHLKHSNEPADGNCEEIGSAINIWLGERRKTFSEQECDALDYAEDVEKFLDPSKGRSKEDWSTALAHFVAYAVFPQPRKYWALLTESRRQSGSTSSTHI